MKRLITVRLIAALIIATALTPVAGAVAQDRLRGVALLIGQADYATLGDLPNPVRDARAMDDLLDQLGFDVSRVLDADADEMREEIAQFIADAAEADVALVYFSGHGVELGGQNYLVPVDADLATPETAGRSLVAVDDLLNELARNVPVTILLLDACRTNAFPAGQLVELPGAAAAVVAGDIGLGAIRGPTPVARDGAGAESLGVAIGFAAAPGQAALDGEPGGNSPYAKALLKHFGAGGTGFGDIMTMVAEEVYLETQARQLPWVNSSLRRVLNFGAAESEPGGDEGVIRQGRRELLLSIAAAPSATRAYVETVARNEDVPLAALYGMLDVLDVDTGSGEADLERQLREGARQLREILAKAPGGVKSDPELERLAGLARQAEAEGAIDVALGFREQATARAQALSGERDALEAALRDDRIEIAATYAEHADTAVLNFDYAKAAEMSGLAFGEVERWDVALALRYKWDEADALKSDGEYRGETASIERAIAAYEQALTLAPRDSQPEAWASLHNNMGNALELLAGRSGDRAVTLRAIDAFHAALEVFSPDQPLDYAMAQNNLGIALTDLALGETGTERLEEAIAALRRALAGRPREEVPLDWATTLNNLGSALKLMGERTEDETVLREAAASFEAALGEYTRANAPLDWAMTHNNLGNVLAKLADLAPGPGQFEAALEAYDLALLEYRRERTPLDWAMTQQNRGIALKRLGEATDDVARIEEAVAAYELALGEYRRERVPMQWAMTKLNLGNALLGLPETGALDRAIVAFREALEIYSRDNAPNEWGSAVRTLAVALLSKAMDAGDDPALLDESISLNLEALDALEPEQEPQKWAVVHQALALALDIRSEQLGDRDMLEAAIAAALEAEAGYELAGADSSAGLADWVAGMRDRLAAGGEAP